MESRAARACASEAGAARRRSLAAPDVDAELIALTRAVGIPLAVLARDYQCTERTLLRRRQRAESALRNRLRAASGSL